MIWRWKAQCVFEAATWAMSWQMEIEMVSIAFHIPTGPTRTTTSIMKITEMLAYFSCLWNEVTWRMCSESENYLTLLVCLQTNKSKSIIAFNDSYLTAAYTRQLQSIENNLYSVSIILHSMILWISLFR